MHCRRKNKRFLGTNDIIIKLLLRLELMIYSWLDGLIDLLFI